MKIEETIIKVNLANHADIPLNKLYLDEELAAEKMIKVWEKISDKKLTSLSNFKTLEFILKYENIKKL